MIAASETASVVPADPCTSLAVTVTVPSHAAVLAPARAVAPVAQVDALQPVFDVPRYLEGRKAARHWRTDELENGLFLTLSTESRGNLKVLLGDEPGDGAFDYVLSQIAAKVSCSKACAAAYNLFRSSMPVSLKRFRAQFDLWRKSGDWVSLVNRSKAGVEWQKRDDGLSDLFLEFCEQRIAKYRRADGKRQAILSIHRQWRTHRTPEGYEQPIPGYGDRPVRLNGRMVTGGFWEDWVKANFPGQLFVEAPLPPGWSEDNISRQVKARGKLKKAVTALIREGTAAAKEFLPTHLTSRVGLRFLEKVTFDDLRTDFIVFDPITGQPCELWLLIARDHATAMVLGFVMHLSHARENGTASHLGLKEMKQLAAWLLERYPLPEYQVHWLLERGTATLPKSCADALQEMLPGRIKLHYNDMIGGKSPVGYREHKVGNSDAKASHESHNRLTHTQLAYVQGQTGAHYAVRPADLQARADECVEIWNLRQTLPEHLRGSERYALLLPAQAREHLFKIFLDQNFRQDHELEGFDQVLEWFDPRVGKWMPQNTYSPEAVQGQAQFRKRMEMPVERAIKLMAGHTWTKVSPDVIIAFLDHTIRNATVALNGEITISVDGSSYKFSPPTAINLATLESKLGTGRKVLAYFQQDDPAFLHVTDGRGSILGTWFRRARLGFHEQDLLEQAMRYTHAALKSAQQYAELLTTGEREELAAMREHNAGLALERGNEFNSVTVAPEAAPAATSSPVASGLASTTVQRRQAKEREKEKAKREQSARDALLKSADMF